MAARTGKPSEWFVAITLLLDVHDRHSAESLVVQAILARPHAPTAQIIDVAHDYHGMEELAQDGDCSSTRHLADQLCR